MTTSPQATSVAEQHTSYPTQLQRVAQAVIERLVADGHRFLTVSWNSSVASFMQQYGIGQNELVRYLRETSPMRPTGTADSDFVARCGEIAIAVARYELMRINPIAFFGDDEACERAYESMAGRAQVGVADFKYKFYELGRSNIKI